jgi:peptidoglycan/xylan/chitin deacetylase (PgdA/CDA1 family)
MYHYIVDPIFAKTGIGRGLSVSPTSFGKQLDWLSAHGYHTASFDQWIHQTLPQKPIILTFDDGYEDAHSAALPALEAHHMTGTFYIVTGFIGKPGYMTWNELQDLQQQGMEIGAHTVSHQDLSKLTPALQQKQIMQSIDTLQATLHFTIETFAYPSGKYNASTKKILQKAHIPYAVSTHHGIATKKSDSLALPRIRMHDTMNLGETLS